MLTSKLKNLDFNAKNGLVICGSPEVAHDAELYHIHDKALRLGVTAVLFRRKYNDEDKVIDSKPALYIFERQNDLSQEDHEDLHAKIWSAGDVEVYFVLSKTRIDIFNARKPAEVRDGQNLDLTSLRLVRDALEGFDNQRFSAEVFGKGVFWEQEDFSNQLKEEDAPYHRLLDYLLATRTHLNDKQSDLSSKTINKLLIACILIKFLEERKEDDEKHTLDNIYIDLDVNDFADSLIKRKSLSVLEKLSGGFNGSIFKSFTKEEKQEIATADLTVVADFLRANIEIATNQRFLWNQYNFKYLPVELISSIYENFLQKKGTNREKGVVYTPPFLVNFMVDEVMPLDKASDYFSQNQFQVLDPTCGSGVFLVAAYKRMLQWWTINQYRATGKIEPPEKADCQKILEENIVGVDKNEIATLITVFSLTITLLEKVKPTEFWTDLNLDKLRNNIQHKDFFKWAVDAKKQNKCFDLVIGNPPFNDENGKSTHQLDLDLIAKIGFKHSKVAGNKFALQFFEAAMALGEKTFMIIPSNALLYNKDAQNYRELVFKDFTVGKIFDFTHLRESLFVKKPLKSSAKQHAKKKTGRTPVCAVLANPKESNGAPIEHTVVNRLVSSEKKIAFEIDHYDRHFVPHDWAADEKKQFIWKTNLLGGGRLFHLIYRLSLLPTLEEFINSKKWKKARGFEGGTRLLLEDQDVIKGIESMGNPDIQQNTTISSSNLKDQDMYEPPFMIVEQVIGKNTLSVCFIPKDNNFTQKPHLYYNRDFLGIHASGESERTLECVYHTFKANKTKNQLNYQLFVACTSSNFLILHETAIRQGDILNLPYSPNDQDYLQLSNAEKILQDDVLNFYIHLGKAISEKGAGRTFHEKVSKKQLESFGRTFCDTINPMHAENGMFWQIDDVYQTPERTFVIYQFIFGMEKQDKPFEIKIASIDALDQNLKNIIFNNKENASAVFTRITRIYGSHADYDYLILIKPTATRYWLNSIAIRDADETIWDYYEAGY